MTNAVDALLGVAIGDAVGVPYEFQSRDKMDARPATDLIGYGTYNQPPGTWSDDSSLTFCLAEALLTGYDLSMMALNFVRWRREAWWTAHNRVFDIGMRTNTALNDLDRILKSGDLSALETLRYGADEYDNGNGSLMRILPLLWEVKDLRLRDQFDRIWNVSALTHGHIRSAMACHLYLELANRLSEGESMEQAYASIRKSIPRAWAELDLNPQEQKHFDRILKNDVRGLPRNQIRSAGYVMHSIEASIWCLLQTTNYRDAILMAINLGDDTDTTAAIAGGLAGLLYGRDGIPADWLKQLARREDIENLGNRLNQRYDLAN